MVFETGCGFAAVIRKENDLSRIRRVLGSRWFTVSVCMYSLAAVMIVSQDPYVISGFFDIALRLSLIICALLLGAMAAWGRSDDDGQDEHLHW